MASRLISALVLLVACQTAGADIYKWVDAEGVTHFGSQPPIELAVKKVEIGAGRVKTRDVANPYSQRFKEVKKNKEIDAGTGAVAKALTAHLSTVSDNGVDLNCRKAVNNGQHWAKKMYQTSVKNKEDGYVTDANFNQMVSSIEQAQKEMTVSNCESASGKEIEFYRCLSDDDNHLIACDGLH